MTNTRRFGVAAIAIAISVFGLSTANAQFEESAKWVPRSANSIILVRAKDILNSEIGKKENWLSNNSRRFTSGATMIPPWTERLLIASQVDLEMFRPMWTVTVYDKSGIAINVQKVADKLGGQIQTLAGHDAVVLPNDAFLVEIQPNVMVSMTPANRQATVQWLNAHRAAVPSLSPYISGAVKFADKNAHVIIAFDLTDSVSVDQVKERLAKSGVVPESQADGVAAVLANMSGATLGITFTDRVTGAIKFDFTTSPEALMPYAKAGFSHFLDTHGLMIDDLMAWEMKVNGNQILMSGSLSPTGLRQVSSLIQAPLVESMTASMGSGEPLDMKTASQQYYSSVDSLINTMIDKKPDSNFTSYKKWLGKYAQQIDELPIMNVDPDLLKFGEFVANSFRESTSALLQTQSAATTAKGTYDQSREGFYYNGWGYGGGYDGFGGRAGYTQGHNLINDQAKQQGEATVRQEFESVMAARTDIRRVLTERYKVNF